MATTTDAFGDDRSQRISPITGEELQVKFLSDSGENSQSTDAAKLEAQEDIALAITACQVQGTE
jgi:hypothetical protein